MNNVTEGETRGFGRAQHEKNPLIKVRTHVRRYSLAKLFNHVQRKSKFAKMAELLKVFTPKTSTLQQTTISSPLRMRV